ncbi:hypothetical protein [Paenibacillus campi]|uniref:hypothetical protein n=1 Tax=Paenibacillus campi TaxID=3106031 RepID=UPI002AFFC2B7|nr:hypothetical protein [Paenibacillus sp. SGZ-1014]
MNNQIQISKSHHLFSLAAVIDSITQGKFEGAFLTPETSIIIFTNSSMITANLEDLISDEKEESKKIDGNDLARTVFSNHLTMIQKSIDDATDKTIALYLKNVQIRPMGDLSNSINLPYLCVYADQVVAITFGTASQS